MVLLIQNSAATGFVVMDSNGNPLSAGSNFVGPSHVLVIEALALREALDQVLARGFSHVLV